MVLVPVTAVIAEEEPFDITAFDGGAIEDDGRHAEEGEEAVEEEGRDVEED